MPVLQRFEILPLTGVRLVTLTVKRILQFELLKFRSMRTGAESDGRPQWAALDDPRVTAAGKILRKTHFDVPPQMINVLRGQMSFVGPRPERPEFVGWLNEPIRFYRFRHYVLPGITGWAQVNYRTARASRMHDESCSTTSITSAMPLRSWT